MASCNNDLMLVEENVIDDEEFMAAIMEMQSEMESSDKHRLPSLHNDKSAIVVKSAKTNREVKLRKKIFRPRRGEIDNNSAITSVLYRKQLRRRSSAFMLYAFPSFDRCDSLLFLPSTMMSHLNRSDMTALSKLFKSYMDKDCLATMTYLGDEAIDVNALLKFHKLLDDLNPDAIVCVHSTKVVENQIHATAYTKFVASKTIYDSVGRSVDDPVFMPIFGLQCKEIITRYVTLESRDFEEKNNLLRMVAHVDAGCDLLLYLQLDLVYTFDDFTKKITHYHVAEHITSIEPVMKNLADIGI